MGLVGALLLGAAGLACGFLGPMALDPGANQGPLLGIFVTGPLGVLIGLGLGVAVGNQPIDRWKKLRRVGVGAAVYAAVILLAIWAAAPS